MLYLDQAKYEKPVWNLHDTLGLPKWLSLSVNQRTRYESLSGSFTPRGTGGDQQIAVSNRRLASKPNWVNLPLGTEFLDARALLADSGSKTLSNTACRHTLILPKAMSPGLIKMFYTAASALRSKSVVKPWISVVEDW